MNEFFSEVGLYPLFLLIGSIVCIGLIATVGKCDAFGNIYH